MFTDQLRISKGNSMYPEVIVVGGGFGGINVVKGLKDAPDLAISGHPEVFVIGDAAQAIDANTGQPTPGVAQGAIQMGRLVAQIIKAEVEGDSSFGRPAFHYKDKGSMAFDPGRSDDARQIGAWGKDV